MSVEKYLRRIGIDREVPAVTATVLALLQRQHLLRVPFENLDIHWKRPIVLDTDKFFHKIVEEERGGFCYEQNGLFSAMLNDLGFKGRMVSARVGNGHGDFSPEYDHMAVIVTFDDEEYLADVGFGAFAAGPLRLELDIEQEDRTGTYRISQYDEDYLVVGRKDGDGWRNEYIFTVKPRDLAEFTAMCEFHQNSPDSHFMKNKLCSLMTASGRKTLTQEKFIETSDGERTETAVLSEEQFNEILKREFNIESQN
jgi:N-hydroxyarylamine O-acetyltransferase